MYQQKVLLFQIQTPNRIAQVKNSAVIRMDKKKTVKNLKIA